MEASYMVAEICYTELTSGYNGHEAQDGDAVTSTNSGDHHNNSFTFQESAS